MAAPTIQPMPLTVGDRPIRPLTADDVIGMFTAGILGEDDRVELLHGVLTAVSRQGPPHAAVVERLTMWLAPAAAAGVCRLRVQLPFAVPDPTSLPVPDVAVVERDEGDPMASHPTSALLVIEVAHTSHRVDLVVKPPLYAAAGVPEYWVVDIDKCCLEVFKGPHPDGYAERATLAPPAEAQPKRVPVDPLDLAALLAGSRAR
jgi:Uma2 family endonuclease